MKRFVSLLVVAGSLAAGWAGEPAGPIARVDLVGFPSGFEPGLRTFASEGVLELRFGVELDPPVTGTHILELVIVNPNGHHFQTLVTPITGDQGLEGRLVKVPGYPNAIPAQLLSESAASGDHKGSVALRLPVAGTPILVNSLYGEWGFSVRLDGEGIDCEGPTTFTMLSPTTGVIFADGFESGDDGRWTSTVP